jgi:cytochrome c oxidase cbb3-type subunit 4
MTVVCLGVFIAIVWWAYGKGQQQRFEEAAALPFTEDEEPGRAHQSPRRTDKG